MTFSVRTIKADSENKYFLIIFDSYKEFTANENLLNKLVRVMLTSGSDLKIKKWDEYTNEDVANASGVVAVSYTHLFGREDGSVVGGHLNKAVISATCEIIIHRINGVIGRKFDDEIGLNIIEFN